MRSTTPTHRSFRLTTSDKNKLFKSAFRGFTPEKFQRAIKKMQPNQIKDKDMAKFVREMQGDHTITSREEAQKFSRGLMKTGHQEHVRMREGFNPAGHEYEQGGRLLKEFEKAQTPPATVRAAPDQDEMHRTALAQVRNRNTIQHGQAASTWKPQTENPAPLGDSKTPSARGPVFNPTTRGFTGGRVTTQLGSHSATVIPQPQPVTPLPPAIPGGESAETPMQPPAPDSASPQPSSEPVIPDANKAQDLPI